MNDNGRYRSYFQFRADFSNFLNHAQYTAGLINSVKLTSQTSTRVFLQPNNPNFQQWSNNFSSNFQWWTVPILATGNQNRTVRRS